MPSSTNTVSVDQARSTLLDMAQRPDPYPFLTFVEDYLAVVPQDDQVRAAAIGTLLQKGLFSVAIELARACPAESSQAGELNSAADKLAKLRSDRLEWSAYRDRFAANVRVLRDRYPELAEAVASALIGIDAVVETLPLGSRFFKSAFGGLNNTDDLQLTAPDDLTLHHANDGNLLIRARRSDGRWMWVPAALDFANTIESLGDTHSWKNTFPSPFLLDTVGLGWLVPRLHAASTHTCLNYSPAIYIVEPNLRALAVALHLHDWTAALSDERVYIFGGTSAWDDWHEQMLRNECLPVPQRINGLHQWPGSAPSRADELLQSIVAHRESLYQQHRQRACDCYSGRDTDYWQTRYDECQSEIGNRKSEIASLRVLGVTSRFTTFLQHSMRDALAAFERAGMTTHLMIEQKDHNAIPDHVYMATIADFQPDLIFLIDHHRHEYPRRFLPNIPFVCWIQDELPNLYHVETGNKLGSLDFTIGFGLSRCVSKCQYPIERFMPCKLAINPEKFAQRAAGFSPRGAAQAEACGSCDLAYVSHQSEPPELFHHRVRQQVDENVRRLFDAFYEQTRPLLTGERFNAAYHPSTLFANAESASGIHFTDPAAREHWMGMYVRPLIDRTLRHTTLEWIADWAEARGRTVHLYGNGWDTHPRFARYAKGPAGHGQQLGDIARSARINLHCGSTPALHQRVLEICASGGFVMVRYHPHDFYPLGFALFAAHVRQMGIDRPCRIPLRELPEEAVRALRRHADVVGEQLGDAVEITEEFLIELKSRQDVDRRYYHAEFALPHFKDVTFDSPATFAVQADAFLADDNRRQTIATDMQHAVGELFTYDALVPRIVNFIHNALRGSNEQASNVSPQLVGPVL